MDDRALWEPEMRRAFLSQTDAPCPHCNYNLRGSSGDKCPECAAPLTLAIAPTEQPARRWELIAAIAVILSSIYFLIMAIFQVRWAMAISFAGSSLAATRLTLVLSAGTGLIMTILSGGWCIAIFALRDRRPRPTWARPTSAAAGVLLGTFIVYLLLHTVRAIFL